MNKLFIAFAIIMMSACTPKTQVSTEVINDTIEITQDSAFVDSVIVEHGDTIGVV